jgi:hypothetical protein
MTNHRTSIKEAAAEIVALINARPSSPQVEETEAIIARVASQAAPNFARSPLLDRLEVALHHAYAAERRFVATDEDDADRALNDANAAVHAFETEIPSPPRSFADVLA